jgi:hypothetical protein
MAHRLGVWTAVIGIFLYVLNIGSWVGAAEEKFKDAETVEQKQAQILLEQTEIKTKQVAIEKQLDKIEQQMKEDKKEILEAIKELEE